MIKLRISEDALNDVANAQAFYDGINKGLGDYFEASLYADIERLRVTAGTHRIVYRDYHRSICRAFPYGIFYTLEENLAVIWAIIDLRRNPSWITGYLDRFD